MDSNSIGLVLGFIIAAISVIASAVISIFSKYFESKKEINKTIFECALEDFKFRNLLEKEKREKQNKEFTPKVASFNDYFIYYSRITKVISKNIIQKKHCVVQLKNG